ncbi:hypothetical protein [Lactococcus garvieae]|uniref:hypothetical protein n=1 Tax=Lactococcus garvieae TaxID=1363 RepID=UPI00254B879B|nr:hypothetical protein [Lactococcus garvieae]
MDKQEINSLLICEIEKLGVVYRLGDLDNQKAFISLELGFGAYTELATPFDHAHEYMHAYYKDERRQGECDTLSPAEKRANKEAILLLWEWFVQRGGTFDDIAKFCEVTGCPYQTTDRLIRSMCYDVNDKSFKECAVDYISKFDVITRDNLNIYNFLDCYGYHYNAFDEARDLIFELCWFELV